jgi:hypothetical protein
MKKYTDAMENHASSQLTMRKSRISVFRSFENPFDRQVSFILSTTASQALAADFNRISQDMKKAIAAYEEKFGKKLAPSTKKP